MHRNTTQKKLREIAAKHGISLATVNEIVRTQFEVVKATMNTADFDTHYYPVIGLVNLGKFVVTDARKWNLIHKRKPKSDDIS